jgi:hypothetical protein
MHLLQLVVDLLAAAKLFLVRANELANAAGAFEKALGVWRVIRHKVLLPTLQGIVMACMVMSVIVLVEKTFLGLVSGYVKLFRRKPGRIYKCDPIGEDEELGSVAHPMVLVQIPMYNEKEVNGNYIIYFILLFFFQSLIYIYIYICIFIYIAKMVLDAMMHFFLLACVF